MLRGDWLWSGKGIIEPQTPNTCKQQRQHQCLRRSKQTSINIVPLKDESRNVCECAPQPTDRDAHHAPTHTERQSVTLTTHAALHNVPRRQTWQSWQSLPPAHLNIQCSRSSPALTTWSRPPRPFCSLVWPVCACTVIDEHGSICVLCLRCVVWWLIFFHLAQHTMVAMHDPIDFFKKKNIIYTKKKLKIK